MYVSHPQNCCTDTTKLQSDYYGNQAGNGLAHFTGGDYQRGHGLGTVISGLKSHIVPLVNNSLVAKAAKSLKRKALTAGIEIASDVVSGKKLKTAIKERVFKNKSTSRKKAPTKRKGRKGNAKKKSTSSSAANRRATSHHKNNIFE